MSKRHFPNFYGIGVQKAGTSWLFANLNKLPEFDLLPIKEIHYFDNSIAYPSRSELTQTQLIKRIKDRKWLAQAFANTLKGKNLQLKLFYFKWYFSNYNDNWYHSLFKNTKGITGEITPSYSFLEVEDIKKMYAINPQAKLILMLRNPIERAWSQYRFQTRHQKNFDFEQVNIEDIIAFINKKSQLLRSDYLTTIKNYTSVFPKEQIRIGFFDAIKDNPTKLLTEIVNFIGLEVDAKYISDHCDFAIKENVSKSIDCPENVLNHLKDVYYDSIIQLANTYGSYCNQWLSYYPEAESSINNKDLAVTVAL